jgi:glycogen operon protein
MVTRPDRGAASPLGATPLADGVNFSVYANKAEAMELLLFDHVDAAVPASTGSESMSQITGGYLRR